MKPYKQIAKQLAEKLGVELPKSNPEWIYYVVLSGYYGEDYFDIYFMELKSKELEISHTTDNPQQFIDMIKSIDTDVVITYTETIKQIKYI